MDLEAAGPPSPLKLCLGRGLHHGALDNISRVLEGDSILEVLGEGNILQVLEEDSMSHVLGKGNIS